MIEADIRDYVQHCQVRYDLIVMDIAITIGNTSPDWIIAPAFLKGCRQSLSTTGHIAINLIVESEQGFMTQLAAIREAFDRQTVCVSLPEHRNVIVLAFNQAKSVVAPNPQTLEKLEAQWQVEFVTFYQQMLKDNPKGSGVI